MNQSHGTKTKSSGKIVYTLMYTLGLCVVFVAGIILGVAEQKNYNENNFVSLTKTEWSCAFGVVKEDLTVECLLWKKKGVWQDGAANKPNFGYRKHDVPKGESL